MKSLKTIDENMESLNRVKIQENNERETMTLKDRQEVKTI